MKNSLHINTSDILNRVDAEHEIPQHTIHRIVSHMVDAVSIGGRPVLPERIDALVRNVRELIERIEDKQICPHKIYRAISIGSVRDIVVDAEHGDFAPTREC